MEELYFDETEINENKDEDVIEHYGMPRRSGRYPWGSGENPYQHNADFLARVEQLKESGKSDQEIAKELNLSLKDYVAKKAVANNERRELLVQEAENLRKKGYSLQAITEKMGYKNDSSVRALLDPTAKARMLEAKNTADFLRKQIEEKGIIDVGKNVNKELNVSQQRLDQALIILKDEGYELYQARIPQVTNKGQFTTIRVVAPKGTPYKEVYNTNIHQATDYIYDDKTDTFNKKWVYPASMDSSRLKINYAEDGGKDKDGVIEIKRGVKDLDLGDSTYAQVRILVDGDRYLKGMAIYSDPENFPEGTDIIFNTNKSKSVPKRDVLKKISNDPENPFGSLIKEGIVDPDDPSSKGGGQSYYIDDNGNKKLSLINKRAEEGDWNEWSNKVPSQFLAKQNKDLIKKQLNLSYSDKKNEYDEIMALENPIVKKKMLESFADDCDSSSVYLKAASLPRQRYQVILPVNSLKDNEVYAQNYKNGETVALIRFPHAGTFEIPILKVNNKQENAKKIVGMSKDAIGINSKVAERLSGADFDGDTVLVIPCNSANSNVKITSTDSLEGLKGFDPKMSYPKVDGMKLMKHTVIDKKTGKEKIVDNTQVEMGKISNLITDMTIKGATEDEMVRAVKHSMVVIDAGKHELNYKKSELDNGIKQLKERYQAHINPDTGEVNYGASTLLSRAKSQQSVDKRQGSPKINIKGKPWYDPTRPEGVKIYSTSDDLYYTDKGGKIKKRTQVSTKMEETDDALTLSSGYKVENLYGNYANKLKNLANSSRKEAYLISTPKRNPASEQTYKKEVESLKSKLLLAEKNAPKERQAQFIANNVINTLKKEYDLTKDEIRKLSQRELVKARLKTGAKRTLVDITEKEWEAIQMNAISGTLLSNILDHSDLDKVKELATPKALRQLSSSKIAKIKSMKSSGKYSIYDIAEALGVSTSTVQKYM